MSWLYCMLKKSRPARKRIDHGGFLPKVEPLDGRVLPAVTASFSAAGGLLRVIGDGLDNTVVVSRDAGGTILVNGGAVAIQGDSPTVANTRMVMIVGAGGNDNLSLDETNGPMPAASIFGGDGNDVLTGGSGSDFIDGGPGNDMVFLGAGDDTFQWNPGDGSDVVEGQGGRDTMVFNGSDAAEKIDISADGSRVRLTRDVGAVTMDLNGVEQVDFNALGGADTITVNDLSGTDLKEVNLDLNAATGAGDGQADSVTVNGTNGDDHVEVLGSGDTVMVDGLPAFVTVSGSEGDRDQLIVNALGGDDFVSAAALPAGVIRTTLDGGAGNDTLLGSQGPDTLLGGDGNDSVDGNQGNDTVFLGDGRDTFQWDPGDGSDVVEGQAGFDTMFFNGSDAAEKIDISAAGSRVQFTRDVGAVTMDLNGIEEINFNALGGADTITVNDLSATDLSLVDLDLNGSAFTGDGQPDAVIVNGTARDDAVQIAAVNNGMAIAVGGLVPSVNITGAEGANDHLTVNTLGGNDVVDTSGLPAGLIGLTVNLGDGQAAAATTTTLRTSTATAVLGQPVLLTASVNSPGGTPTGTVTFLDGNTVVGTAAVGAEGTARLRTSFAAAGGHAITAVYSGDGRFAGSSQTLTEQVSSPPAPAPTTIALAASGRAAHKGRGVSFTATVRGDPGAGTPTGTVRFLVGNRVVARVRLNAVGQASFRRLFAAGGRFVIRAVYEGDGNFAGSSQALVARVRP
jgi:Ca2+-binding RTX toxin-like protein